MSDWPWAHWLAVILGAVVVVGIAGGVIVKLARDRRADAEDAERQARLDVELAAEAEASARYEAARRDMAGWGPRGARDPRIPGNRVSGQRGQAGRPPQQQPQQQPPRRPEGFRGLDASAAADAHGQPRRGITDADDTAVIDAVGVASGAELFADYTPGRDATITDPIPEQSGTTRHEGDDPGAEQQRSSDTGRHRFRHDPERPGGGDGW